MAIKKQSSMDRKDHLSQQLQNISHIVQLCAFAAEARRVLGDIDLAAEVSPSLGESLDRLVEARAEWSCHDDNLGIVLRAVAIQIDAAHELVHGLKD